MDAARSLQQFAGPPEREERSHAMSVTKIALALAAAAAVGCFQGQRVIKLNADGSGTLVDTVKLTEEAAAMMAGFESMGETAKEETAAEKKAKEEAKYKEKAGEMGLEFVSLEKGDDDSARVTYRFADVNALKIGPFPTLPSESDAGKDPMAFRFKSAGGKAVLTLAPTAAELDGGKPEAAAAEAEKKKSAEEVEQEMQMLKGMMAGLKVDMIVEVNGKLLKSSSPHTKGNAVTFFGIDFDQLDEKTMRLMAGSQRPDFAELAGAKGLTLVGGPVTIEFSK
jgi:hypothetical protein